MLEAASRFRLWPSTEQAGTNTLDSDCGAGHELSCLRQELCVRLPADCGAWESNVETQVCHCCTSAKVLCGRVAGTTLDTRIRDRHVRCCSLLRKTAEESGVSGRYLYLNRAGNVEEAMPTDIDVLP